MDSTGSSAGGARRSPRARWPLAAAAVLVVPAVGLWLGLGGLRPTPPISEEVALGRAADLGEQMRAAVQNGRDVDALAPKLEALVAERPGLAAGWTLLGQVRLLGDEDEAASAAFTRALELRAQQGGAENADAELHLLAGSAAEKVDRLIEAEEHFAEARRLAPDDARATLRLAHTAQGLGENEVAASLAEQATALDDGLAAGWALRGQLALEAGDAEAAMAATERAAALTAETGGVEARAYALSLARLLREEGEPLLAARVLRLPHPEDFFTPAVMAAHAEALDAAGLPEGAANYYERWLALDPTNALAAAEATRWYLEAGNTQQARATLVVLERIDPRDARLERLKADLARVAEASAAG